VTALRILANPRAGRGRQRGASDTLRELAGRHSAELRLPESPEELVREAREAVSEGVQRLAVAGGDGTLNLVAGALEGSGTALGILPVGTGNDFARALGIPLAFDAAIATVSAGPVDTVDLGHVAGRPFVTVAGVGFHGTVARVASEPGRLLRGPVVYSWAVLRTLGRYEPPEFRVRYDDGSYADRAWMVVLANSPWFGGGMRIAPAADPTDGLLDLVVVRGIGRGALLRVFPKVYRGTHVDHPAVVVARTREATIEIERPDDWYGDGDPLLESVAGPVTIGVRPRALRVIRGGATP
jgi:YegS/Rv2252/BmrU family lipid kinase